MNLAELEGKKKDIDMMHSKLKKTLGTLVIHGKDLDTSILTDKSVLEEDNSFIGEQDQEGAMVEKYVERLKMSKELVARLGKLVEN